MKTNSLIVPIQIDALHLNADSAVLEAMADFSKLPYQSTNHGARFDKNSNTPYLSESVALAPFSNQNLTLSKGVHLHWALPDALVKAPGESSALGEGQSFPAVPNRWLISRIESSKTTKQWVVESDYLYPLDAPPTLPHVSVPMPAVINKKGEERVEAVPFRYMGRVWALADWQKEVKEVEEYWSEYYQQPLTAVGYGEPNFAAYYPNCHTVFGFHDDSPPSSGTFSYQIIGWYEATEGYTKNPDYITHLVRHFDQQSLVVYQQPLLEQYKRLGRIAWKALQKTNGGLTPTLGKVSPEGYGAGWTTTGTADQTSMQSFLKPTAIKSITDDAIDGLTKKLWTEITATYAAAVSGTAKKIATFRSSKVDGSIPYITAYEKTALSDFLDPNKHLTLLKQSDIKADTIAGYSAQDIWQQLEVKQWIAPIVGLETSFAAIIPTNKRRPLDEGFRSHKTVLVSLLQKKPPFLSQVQLKSQLTTFFAKVPSACLFPIKRLVDRYGSNASKVQTAVLKSYTITIKKKSKTVQWLLPFSDDYLFLSKAVLLKEAQYPTAIALSPAGLQALVKSDICSGNLLNPHGQFAGISSTDISNRFGTTNGPAIWTQLYTKNYVLPTLGATTANLPEEYTPLKESNGSLKKSNFINYFVQQATQVWQEKVDQHYFLASEAYINTTLIGQQLAPPEELSEQINQLIFTISKSDITKEFGDEYDDVIWNLLIHKQWISLLPDSYTQAYIQPQEIAKNELPVDSRFPNYASELKTLLNPRLRMITMLVKQVNKLLYRIQKDQFTNQFGLEIGNKIWEGLLLYQWITPIDELNASINNLAVRKKLDTTLDSYMESITRLLNPKVYRQSFVDAFGESADAIWQMLLEDQTILADPKSNNQGVLVKASAALNSPDFVQYEYKVALQNLLHRRLKWHFGVVVQQTTFNTLFGTSKGKELWQTLIQNQWILPTKNASLNEAIIEPLANRTPLSNKDLPYKDLIEDFFYKTILAQDLPDQSLFFSKIDITTGSTTLNSLASNKQVQITAANSNVEAISTYLANAVRDTSLVGVKEINQDKAIKSDILEGIQFARKLENVKFDLAAQFKALRHERTFSTQQGGILWTIQPLRNNDKDNPNSNEQVNLPPDLAHELNYLNTLQKKYEKAHQQIESLRHQLFNDWYKYMLCAYPPLDAGLYPNIDKVKYFIEQFDLSTIRREIEAVGELKIVGDRNQITNAIGHFVDIDTEGLDYRHLAVVETLNHINATLLGEDAAYRSTTQAHIVAQQIRKIIEQIEAFNASQLTHASPQHFTLSWIPGSRYWMPKEPVLMLTGDAVLQTDRYGKDGSFRPDGLLDCFILESDASLSITKGNINQIYTSISTFITKLDKATKGIEGRKGFNVCKQQPWHPLMLEWDASFYSFNDPDPSSSGAPMGYDPTFIDDNYDLPEELPSYQLKMGGGMAKGDVSVYHGFSLLSPSAVGGYQQRLLHFLQNTGLQLDANGNFTGIVEKTNISASYRRILETASTAYTQLKTIHSNSLSQNIMGFNAALLQQKQALQFKVADPLGFDEYQKFTNRVRKYIGAYNLSAPAPLCDFNPLRAGQLELRKLRIIDSFGQVLSLDVSKIQKVAQFENPYDSIDITLPPRIMQPARLNLRWLSASPFDRNKVGLLKEGEDLQVLMGDDMEMNYHPASTPICGWVILNKLDDSLLIYNKEGTYIGIINENAQWMAPPGNDRTIAVSEIVNPHLREMVTYLLTKAKTKGFLNDFITASDNALENIHPEYFSEHQDLALLMSRPMALVRIALGLEVKGLLANNVSWESFRLDMERALFHFPEDVVMAWLQNNQSASLEQIKAQVSIWSSNPTYDMDGLQSYVSQQGSALTVANLKQKAPTFVKRKAYQPDQLAEFEAYIRETYNFENVNFPVRLGDYRQLNDGLVGYWHSSDGLDGSIDPVKDKLYMPQTTLQPANFSDDIILGAAETLMLDLKINQKPIKLSLLIDPTGSLHATSGVLPVKKIEIPADQYKTILNKLQLTFLAAPLLTPKDKLSIPLPKTANFEWTWLQKVKGKWKESPLISKADFMLGWAGATGDLIWMTLKQSYFGKDFGSKTTEEIVGSLFPTLAADQQDGISNFLNTHQIKASAPLMPQQQLVHLWTQEKYIALQAAQLWDYLFTIDWLTGLGRLGLDAATVWTTLNQSFYEQNFDKQILPEIIKTLFPTAKINDQLYIIQFMTRYRIATPTDTPLPQPEFEQLWNLDSDAMVIPKRKRTIETFSNPWTGWEKQTAEVLTLYQWSFASPHLEGTFDAAPRLVEGYLKLKRIDNKKN